VHRNFFGSQIHSFEADIAAPACLPQAGPCSGSFKAVFIRAPAVMSVGEGVEVIAEYHLTEEEEAVSVSFRSCAGSGGGGEGLQWHCLAIWWKEGGRPMLSRSDALVGETLALWVHRGTGQAMLTSSSLVS